MVEGAGMLGSFPMAFCSYAGVILIDPVRIW